MNDAEIRVRCVEAAAQVPGNPNTLQQAREFYDFVMEGHKPEPIIVEKGATIIPNTTPKGKAK